MMNIIRSVLLPPICGPQLMPETENGAGGLHRLSGVLQVATPFPCSPPTTNAPFISFGMTATHLAPSSTLLGTPLSGDAVVMFFTVSVARSSSDPFAALFSSCACASTNEPRQHTKNAMTNLPFVTPGIAYLLAISIRSTARWFSAQRKSRSGQGFCTVAALGELLQGWKTKWGLRFKSRSRPLLEDYF